MKTIEYASIIKRYELARQAVAALQKKRKWLLLNCSKINEGDLFDEICLVKAHKDWVGICNDNGELYDYGDILSEGVAEGVYCQNCQDSFNIKHNELADAKAEFGKAKRSLSFFGKKLLKGDADKEVDFKD